MNNDNLDAKFIEKCRSIDFSVESANRERNLEVLKTKLLTINAERENKMNRKMRRPVAIAAVVAAVICLSMGVVYGQDLWRIVRSVTLGNHANFTVYEDTTVPGPEAFKIPDEFVGQVYDKDGNLLTHFPRYEGIYNADGEQLVTMYIDDTLKITTLAESRGQMIADLLTFTDLEEGHSHFITDVLMPSWLPEGYTFQYITYFVDSLEILESEPEARKYMSVYYGNGKDMISSQVRFMDEYTAFEAGGSADIQELKINGYDAVLDGNVLNLLIGDVMYMFFANENLNSYELIKIAESLE